MSSERVTSSHHPHPTFPNLPLSQVSNAFTYESISLMSDLIWRKEQMMSSQKIKIIQCSTTPTKHNASTTTSTTAPDK